MKPIVPQDIANKWAAKLGAAGPAYIAGTAAVTVAPTFTAQTDLAMDAYQRGCAQSVSSGYRRMKLLAVTLGDWQQQCKTFGAPALAAGAAKAKNKVIAHFQTWAPIYKQASDAAKALPKGGMANALARVQAAIQVMMDASKRKNP